MDKITFNGIDYPVRFIQLTDFGVQTISVESLEDVLMDDESFVNEEAMYVDSQIFFYVPDEIIDDEEKIISYTNRHLS